MNGEEHGILHEFRRLHAELQTAEDRNQVRFEALRQAIENYGIGPEEEAALRSVLDKAKAIEKKLHKLAVDNAPK